MLVLYPMLLPLNPVMLGWNVSRPETMVTVIAKAQLAWPVQASD